MKLTLINKQSETDEVTSFYWKPEASVTWKAGQYFHYTFQHENPDDRGIERWFTCSAAPFEENIRITTKFANEKSSSFKKALFALEPGTTIEADGPEGSFTLEDFSQHYVFIAGGIGITPFRSILAQANHDGQKLKVDLMYTNRNDNYVFENELNNIMANMPEFKLHKFTDPKLIEEDDIRKLVLDINAPKYYISGPKPMVEHYKEFLQNLGILEQNIKLDDFPGYDQI